MNQILIISFLLLAFGTVCLLVVRLNNPILKGLGWLSGAFGAGACAALLRLLSAKVLTSSAVIGAHALVLIAFVLLDEAFLEMLDHPFRLPRLGSCLLLTQLLVDLLRLHHPGLIREIQVEGTGLLVAIQATHTAWLLIRSRKTRIRASIFFNAFILICFIIANVAGSVTYAVGIFPRSAVYSLTEAVFVLYIAVALGLAFGMFWMTTAKLCAELEHMASTDPLTRLYNRRIFLEWCEKEKLRSHRTARPFSLLMVDLDHFKQVNDRFGHSAGDAILCAVVERMQDAVRGIDVLGRWGGEEFVVLLPGASVDAAFLVAQRLRKSVEKTTVPIELMSGPVPNEPSVITVSVGIATYRGSSDAIGDILERADRALYQAKAAGRNRVLTSGRV